MPSAALMTGFYKSDPWRKVVWYALLKPSAMLLRLFWINPELQKIRQWKIFSCGMSMPIRDNDPMMYTVLQITRTKEKINANYCYHFHITNSYKLNFCVSYHKVAWLCWAISETLAISTWYETIVAHSQSTLNVQLIMSQRVIYTRCTFICLIELI